MRSLLSTPRFSPLIVTRVPGGPSLGEIPVTWGGGLRMLLSIFPSYSQHHKISTIKNDQMHIITRKHSSKMPTACLPTMTFIMNKFVHVQEGGISTARANLNKFEHVLWVGVPVQRGPS